MSRQVTDRLHVYPLERRLLNGVALAIALSFPVWVAALSIILGAANADFVTLVGRLALPNMGGCALARDCGDGNPYHVKASARLRVG